MQQVFQVLYCVVIKEALQAIYFKNEISYKLLSRCKNPNLAKLMKNKKIQVSILQYQRGESPQK
jgi:hypothetical protein